MQNIIAETVPSGASQVSSLQEQEKKAETATALAPGVPSVKEKAEVVSLDKKTNEVNLAEDKEEDTDDDLPLSCVAEKQNLTTQEKKAETTAAASGVPSVQEKKAEAVSLEKKSDEVNPAEDEDEDMDDNLPLSRVAKKRKLTFPSDDEKGNESANEETSFVRGLSDEHKSVLLTVFQEDISKGRILTIAEVRNRMRADLYLKTYVVQPDFVKKIADFVRYKTNHTRHMQLTQLSNWEPEEYVASLSIESGFRKTWNDHDNAVIEAKFSLLPDVKNKKEIINVFSSDEVLSHILQREGTNRCYEKAKNILRRKAK